MAFITIPSAWIQPGRPTKKELFQYIKDNFDDHESRLAIVEVASNNSQVFEREISGSLEYYGVKQGVFFYRLANNWALQSGRIIQFKTTGSGTFEADIQFKRGSDPWASIFTTRPSVTVANGDNYASINGVLAETNLLAADLLRVDITSIQTNGNGGGHWSIIVEYEVG